MDDVEHYSKLYSIIRSNNVDSLKGWLKVTKMTCTSVYHFLGTAYESLHLKNVPISFEMQRIVELTLSEAQFVTQDYKPATDDFKSFIRTKEHLNLTYELIESFLSKYKTQSKTTLSFINDAKLVAFHISVLKRRVDFSYNKLPWEEMEFCIVMLVLVLTKSEETERSYQLLIDKERVLKHLEYFFEELADFKYRFIEETTRPESVLVSNMHKKIVNFEPKKFNIHGKQNGRITNKQIILRNSPQFNELYKDFTLLRDVYSSNQIKHYLELALSVDLDADPTIGCLVIQRAIQVIGEYLKNEKDSPNYSEELYQVLKKLVASNLLPTTASLRNMISHSHTLDKRLEMERNEDNVIFKNIQAELKTINAEIIRVLYKRKIDALKMFLEKLQHCDSIEQLNKMFQHVEPFKSHELEATELPDPFSIKNSIASFWQQIKDVVDENTIDAFMDEIDKIVSSLNITVSSYKMVINYLCSMSQYGDLDKMQNLAKNYLTCLFHRSDLNHVQQDIFALVTIILKKIVDYLVSEQQKSKIAVEKILDFLKWDFRDIRWLETMEDELTNKEFSGNHWKAHLQKLFEIVQEGLELNEGSLFRASVVKKIDIHSAKGNLLNLKDQGEFESALKHMNLKSHIETMILNSYKKRKYKELEDRIKGRIPDAYGVLLNNLENSPSIFPLNQYFERLEKFYSELGLKPVFVGKILGLSKEITYEDIGLRYWRRLSTLNAIWIKFHNADSELSPHLAAALDMLILDLTEYIEKMNALGDNKTLLVEKLPLLRGKQLRNHLAHGNIITRILPYSTDTPLVLYAKGLLDLGDKIITEKGSWTVGFKFTTNDYNMCTHVRTCQRTVAVQDDLFRYVEEGRFEDSLRLINAGADVYSKDINGHSVLDTAIKYKNKRFTDYLISNIVKEENVFRFASPLLILSHYETFTKFLQRTNLDLNFTDQHDSSLLHVAAALGQLEIVRYLLKNNTHINKLNVYGETPLHLACQNGFLDIALLLMDINAEIINKQSNDGATALHCAASKGHCAVVNELIKRNADSSLMIKVENRTAFERAVSNDHKEVVKIFLEKCHITLEDKAKALCLASALGLSVIVQILLEHVKDPMKVNAAAYEAAISDHCDVVAILLNNGAKIDWKHSYDMILLHLASKRGNLEMIILLDNKTNINARDIDMWTPLHFAVYSNSIEAIELLIFKGADPNLFDNKGRTPFHLAATLGNVESIELLLQICPNLDVDHLTNETKESALHLAAREGYIRMVTLLINKGANVKLLDAKKVTPLHCAIKRYGYIDVVSVLIQTEPLIVNLQDNYGMTPLHLAIQAKNKELLEILLQHNADCNIPNNAGTTPLHLTAIYGLPELTCVLLDNGAVCSLVDAGKLSALDLAVELGQINVVKVLVEHESKVNESSGINGSLLLRAIDRENEDMAIFLVRHGIIVDQKSFLLSIIKGMIKLVSEILASGININQPLGLRGITPLMLALIKGHESLALLLLEHEKIDVHCCDTLKWTALHVACWKGLKSCVAKILTFTSDVNAKAEKLFWHPLSLLNFFNEAMLQEPESPSNAQELYSPQWEFHLTVTTALEHHADDNITFGINTTPLHIAILAGHVDITKILLDCGKVRVGEVNDNGYTALHVAAIQENADIIISLLEFNVADIINAVTKYGDTALHLAASRGRREITEMLIACNADVTIQNSLGLTPEDAARNNGFGDIAELFRGK